YMKKIQINFLGSEPDPSKKKFFLVVKVCAIVVAVLGVFAALAASNVISDEHPLSQIPFVKRVRQLIRSADRSLDGERDDRINILLLGMGGVGHEGPYLTDTIILASIKPTTRQVALISIPRDLAVPIPDYGWYKINHANAYGEARARESGGELVRTVLSDVLDMPIHYYVRIDFDGFMKLINDLGGIDVYVERGFVDTSYPTGENGNVRTLAFDAGWQHMDGGSALEFARSRHGSNGEGSDFARARRQQKILQAVKSRVFSLGTLRSPAKVSSVMEALSEHVKMNFSPWELLALARLAGTFDATSPITEVLDDDTDGFLVATIGADGAYLLVPRHNDWNPVRTFIQNIFTNGTGALATTAPIRIELQNGTTITGLAARTAAELEAAGFQVVRLGNAPTRTYTRTIIYDLSRGEHEAAQNELQQLLNAEVRNSAPSGSDTDTRGLADAGIAQAAGAPADFLIILGGE
ncbi:LCP family protein, partial [Candidatus Uhrbacteria bacterium]|nr:LCP family protein [Candidatus Uhrbacteria bacterium]